MKVYNLGSINIDHIYRLGHLPLPGETLHATDYFCGLGGKGANQTLALALGGAEVKLIGAMAHADLHFLDALAAAGADLSSVDTSAKSSGTAIVLVDEQSAENQIILNSAANRQLSEHHIATALNTAQQGDWALCQNETNNADYFLQQAKARGMSVCYSAAPFVAATTIQLLPYTDLLIVNEMEAQSLAEVLNCALEEIPVPHLLVTLGADGARYLGVEGSWSLPSPKVTAVDTSGAGDTFLGFLLAALTKQQSMRESMLLALSAAALQVTRKGTSDAIPRLEEVQTFIATQTNSTL